MDRVIDSVLPDPESRLGARVRERLRSEYVIWLTTVGADGTPQPNPVWFVADDEGVLVYNRADAHRLQHIRRRPQVSLHFDGDGRGGDIVVLRGRATIADDVPPPHQMPAYAEKYASGIRRVSGSGPEFSAAYPVPVRVEITGVRGY